MVNQPLRDQIRDFRQASRDKPREVSGNPSQDLAGAINGGMDSLWDALEVVASAVDELRGDIG